MPARDEDSSLPKTTPTDWVYSTATMPTARFWTPFDPGFGQVLKTLSEYIGSGTKTIEVGFAPGKVLAWAALKRKAKVSGVDYSTSGVTAARQFMQSLGIDADLRNENVFENSFDKDAFDVVYSVGVIEHFDNPEHIVQAHLDLARPGGIVVMFIPNYGGIWGRLQRRIDPANLEIHNIDMMNIPAMTRLMQARRCEILKIGYVGSFSASILVFDKVLPPRLCNYLSKFVNLISTFLPVPIGRLSPQIVTVVRKT